MAASFNAPAPNNGIISDVNAIHDLLGYLAQVRPDLGTNYPAGSVRIITDANTGNWLFQKYIDNAWTTMTTWEISSTSLRGYVPSTSAVAGRIPVYNASGQLVGNITGNAATASKLATPRLIQVGGILSSTAQNFDGSGNITIPVNQVTLNNEADTAVNGTLTKAHGGTGRTDGSAQDVVFDSIAGLVKAKDYGNIGNLKFIGNQSNVNANSLTTSGNYLIHGADSAGWAANNWPIENPYHNWMRVGYSNGILMQHLITTKNEWYRCSDDQAASFSAWMPKSGIITSLTIYISKSGSDNNTGLDSAYPVLTFGRAFQIADKLASGSSRAVVHLRIGAGEWDLITIGNKNYFITMSPYDGQAPNAFSNSLPIFAGLIASNTMLSISGILINGTLNSIENSYLNVGVGYKRIRALYCTGNSAMVFAASSDATNLWEIGSATGSPITVGSGAYISLGTMHIKLISYITASCFLQISWNGTLVTSNSVIFDATTAVFTGKKYIIYSSGNLITTENAYGKRPWLDTLPGTQDGSIYDGAVINGIPYGTARTTNVVDLTSDQTITGHKIINRNSSVLTLKSPTDVVSATPSSEINQVIFFRDKNSAQSAMVMRHHSNTGLSRLALQITGENSSVFTLGLDITKAGDSTAFISSSPASNSNTTHLPTTAWVRARIAEEIAKIDISSQVDTAVANAKMLTQIGYLENDSTSAKSGTWTLTGCKINQPIFVLFNSFIVGHIELGVPSDEGGANGGVTVNAMNFISGSMYFILGRLGPTVITGYNSVKYNIYNTSSDVFVTLPSAATVKIMYKNFTSGNLYAYQ